MFTWKPPWFISQWATYSDIFLVLLVSGTGRSPIGYMECDSQFATRVIMQSIMKVDLNEFTSIDL
jgi:uncharacterized membrane protein (DUF441 family)